MDLFGFANIDNLEELMKKNNIDVPRLRGLRLMSEEKVIPKEEFQKGYKDADFRAVQDACEARFQMNPVFYELSYKTDRLLEYYMDFERREDGSINYFSPTKIHWERLHGKKRKLVKYFARKYKEAIKKQWDMWNKYAGRDDILYIHARLGGGNWDWFNCDKIIKKQLWYLDHCEDNFDRTYVDIYAKIKEGE